MQRKFNEKSVPESWYDESLPTVSALKIHGFKPDDRAHDVRWSASLADWLETNWFIGWLSHWQTLADFYATDEVRDTVIRAPPGTAVEDCPDSDRVTSAHFAVR